MKTMSKNLRRIVSVTVLSVIAMSTLVGCGSKRKDSSVSNTESNAPFKLTIMTNTYTGDPVTENSPVLKKLEELTNTDLQITWVPSTSYPDKLNITLASGELPMVLFAGDKSSSIINAVKASAFWEIGPYMKDYKNLSKANPDVLNNASIEGKTYGLYRQRAYGRNGMTFRKDWLNNLGLQEPKTLDDFYNMLKAFTNNDPDKNGKNDTVGMCVSENTTPFQMTGLWFGAPNKWGDDGTGKLISTHLTKEYMENLKFWKNLYDEKLINQDFAALDPAKWAEMINNGKAGVILDVSDDAQRADEALVKLDKEKYTGAIDAMIGVTGPTGTVRNLPTSGYSGLYMFTKQALKSEADLKKALKFFDMLNDKEEAVLLGNGIEGRQFKVTADGYGEALNDPNVPKNELNDLNQLGINIPDSKAYLPVQTAMRKKVIKLQTENDKLCVANPAEPYISKTYGTKGAQLDNMIEDARVKFIVGQIDEAGFKAVLETWKKSGGEDVTKEINEEYAKYKKK